MQRIRMPIKFALIVMVIFGFVQGCSSPGSLNGYIQPEHPYKRVFYGEFEGVLAAVKSVLEEEGWQIEKETHPSMYERNASFSENDKGHVLIFTDTKQASRLIYSKSSQLNVYVNQTSEGVELDVRYSSITNMHLKKMKRYRNEPLIKKFFNHIENKLLTEK